MVINPNPSKEELGAELDPKDQRKGKCLEGIWLSEDTVTGYRAIFAINLSGSQCQNSNCANDSSVPDEHVPLFLSELK
jgi:hypothetical protein